MYLLRKITMMTLLGLMAGVVCAQTNFRSISFAEAMAAAKQEGKQVFIDFYTDWCGPCKRMAREVFPQPKVGDYFNARFVCIKLNAEKEGKELAQRYNVRAYPTFLVLNDKEEVLLDLKGSMQPDEFIAKVESGLDPEQSPERMAERYQAGDRTPKLINNYALHLMEQRKEEEGFKVVNGYFDSLSDAERLAAPNAFLYTRYTIDLDDPKAKFMVVHREEFDPAVREEVMERIAHLYNAKLNSYFSGYVYREGKFNQEVYESLKNDMQQLGLNDDGKYTPMFRLIECRVTDDDAAFMAACQEEFLRLTPSAQGLLIVNMTRLVQTEDKETLQKMSSFIRLCLPALTPNSIMLSGRILSEIESKINDKR